MVGTVRFAPKIDGFMWGVLLLVGAAFAWPLVEGLVEQDTVLVVSVALIVLAALGLTRVVGVPLYYEITHEILLVRHGVIRRRIPLHEISRVVPTRDLMAAPAPSLDRLQVDCNLEPYGYILIAPADRDGFLDLLAERTELVRSGDRLTWGGKAD